MKIRFLTKAAIFSIAVFSSLWLAQTNASADMLQSSITITPLCTNNETSLAYWTVENTDTNAVSITATFGATGLSNTFSAANGTSFAQSRYFAVARDKQTVFTWNGGSATILPSTVACGSSIPSTNPTDPALPIVPACVDGTRFANLEIYNPGTTELTVQTRGGGLLCEDVTINYSSYVVPNTWDGNGFNPTAWPQTLYGNKRVTLLAGTNGYTIMNIELPPACSNAQVDVYYGPTVTEINEDGYHVPSGIGAEWGALYQKTTENFCTPGQGGGGPTIPQTPVTPATTPVAAVTKETTLVNTGAPLSFSAVVATMLIISATAVMLFPKKPRFVQE